MSHFSGRENDQPFGEPKVQCGRWKVKGAYIVGHVTLLFGAVAFNESTRKMNNVRVTKEATIGWPIHENRGYHTHSQSRFNKTGRP